MKGNNAYIQACLFSCLAFVAWHCSTNIYKPVASSNDREADIEEIKVFLDNREYQDADKKLDKMDITGDEELILLRIATNLGQISLSVFDIFLEIIDATFTDSQAGNVFQDIVGDLLGEDSTQRDTKFEVLRDSIDLVTESNLNSSRLDNTVCFLGLILLGGTLADATEQITAIQTLSNQLGSSSDTCATATELSDSVGSLTSTIANLTTFNEIISGCPLLSDNADNQLITSLTTKIETFESNADQGCVDLPSGIPSGVSCVEEAFGQGGGEAGDGEIATCEIAINCVSGSCF